MRRPGPLADIPRIGRPTPLKTYSPKPEHIERRWYVVDASDKVLGRLASEVAALLRGKHKPIFAPHMDTGDHVIIINADKVAVTGGKEFKKVAYRHSGYPGGITGVRYDELLATRPVFAIEKAVRGMLPKNRLGRSMINKLHVVAGPEHPHAAQRPVDYTLGQTAPVGRPARAEGARAEDQAPSPRTSRRPSPSRRRRRPEACGQEARPPRSRPRRSPQPRSRRAKKTATAKKSTAKKTTAKKSTARSPRQPSRRTEKTSEE